MHGNIERGAVFELSEINLYILSAMSMEKESNSKEELNLYETSLEKKSLRHETPDIMAGSAEEELRNIKQRLKGLIIEGGGMTEVKARLRKEKQESLASEPWIDESSIEQEISEYENIRTISEGISELEEFEIHQQLNLRQNPQTAKVYEKLLVQARKEGSKAEEALNNIRTDSPSSFRAHELISYKKGLHQEGHIAPVPSVKEYLHQIGVRMISGKPMFLHGPTGTGKTSLARYASEHFTGHKAEMVYCNPQTRESSIWGKTGLRPAEGKAGQHGAIETVDIYGPLARAMQEGKCVIFDEFTALPKEQQIFIKGIFNAKTGDTVNVMGNGMVAIQPGFQMIFTANLKSEKNPERSDLPPEIAREFEQNNLEIRYTPKEEAYDIMLARLMNPDGSVDLSWHDLNNTLPKFCEAMAEVQSAYTDKESDETARLTQTMDPSGKKQGLKKLVFTQGTVENVLDAWKIEKQAQTKLSFVEFLDHRLKTALTFKEYPQPDRILAAKILASKGFLRTLTPQDLDLPQDTFNFDAARSLRGDQDSLLKLKQESAKETGVRLKELADLDPFHTRKPKTKDIAANFGIEPETEPEPAKPELEKGGHNDFLLDTFKNFWNYNQQQLDTAEQNLKPELVSPKNLDWDQRKQDRDASRSGEYTLNPETKNLNFDQAKVFIPDQKELKSMEGKSLAEVGAFIQNKYGSKYYLPGIEYWEYIFKNPDKVPQVLKDTKNYYFYFGSLLRYSSGNWYVPYSGWDGSRFDRGTRWLVDGWSSNCRVVLLEK